MEENNMSLNEIIDKLEEFNYENEIRELMLIYGFIDIDRIIVYHPAQIIKLDTFREVLSLYYDIESNETSLYINDKSRNDSYIISIDKKEFLKILKNDIKTL